MVLYQPNTRRSGPDGGAGGRMIYPLERMSSGTSVERYDERLLAAAF
jgi:hypothetical protein